VGSAGSAWRVRPDGALAGGGLRPGTAAPAALRPAAAVTMRAHLEKLAQEGRLPAEVEVPPVPSWLAG